MPAEQLELLDNPAFREAVSVVLERTDGGEEEIEWADVSDSLSSGQWGRLIQEGVVVGGTSGFTLDNPQAIRRQLATDDTDGLAVAESEAPESSWQWYDKVAALGALGLFAGYWNTGIRDTIASVDNLLLAPVTELLPFHVVVLLLAVATGLYSTVLQGRLLDHEKLQQYQERMQRLSDRREQAKERGDDEALEQIQAEQLDAAGDQLGMFKLQFRPMVWIMLLTIPVFLWLRWKVRGGHLGAAEELVVPIAGAVGWQEPLLGPMSAWIVWYFLCSLASRQLIQKGLGVQTTPSNND